MRKRDKISLISNEDLPRDYLTAPAEHKYRPELETLNAKRRREHGFETRMFNPATEKFYRLYFYQGLSQPDRLSVHTELMEMRSWRYFAIGGFVGVSLCSFFLMGSMIKYAPFMVFRLGASALLGNLVFTNMKAYAQSSVEKAIEPFYEKYGIR